MILFAYSFLAKNRLQESYRNEEYKVHSPYFKYDMFKNGNIHMVFLREDLVEKLNEMLATYYNGSLGQRSATY